MHVLQYAHPECYQASGLRLGAEDRKALVQAAPRKCVTLRLARRIPARVVMSRMGPFPSDCLHTPLWPRGLQSC